MRQKIKDNKDFIRDSNNGAILRINNEEIENYKRLRDNKIKESIEIAQLKNEINDLKKIVFSLLNKEDNK